jgi:hypothetical protein
VNFSTYQKDLQKLNSKINAKTKIRDAWKQIGAKSPVILKKVAKGAKHIQHGFSVTFKDAVYWYKLKGIDKKTITEIRD